MNKKTKAIYYLHNFLIGLLLLVMVAGAVVWIIMDRKAEKEWQAVQSAIILVKEEINWQATDNFNGCVHPDIGVTIVMIDHDVLFGVKDGKVFIPRMGIMEEKKSKEYGPNLPVEAHDVNPYYLYEYCYYHSKLDS